MTAEEVLAALDIFAEFPPEFLGGLVRAAEACSYRPGDCVVRQGEPATAFFVVTGGRAEVVLGAKTPDERVIATLGPGSFFGEMAILREGTRTATVRAATDLDCLVLTRAAFESELRRHPHEAAVLMPRFARRLRVIEH